MCWYCLYYCHLYLLIHWLCNIDYLLKDLPGLVISCTTLNFKRIVNQSLNFLFCVFHELSVWIQLKGIIANEVNNSMILNFLRGYQELKFFFFHWYSSLQCYVIFLVLLFINRNFCSCKWSENVSSTTSSIQYFYVLSTYCGNKDIKNIYEWFYHRYNLFSLYNLFFLSNLSIHKRELICLFDQASRTDRHFSYFLNISFS